jgi:hypothetical protein
MDWYWWVILIVVGWVIYRSSITGRMNKDPKQFEMYAMLKGAAAETDDPFSSNPLAISLLEELSKIRLLDGKKKYAESIAHLHSLLSIDNDTPDHIKTNAAKLLTRLSRNV